MSVLEYYYINCKHVIFDKYTVDIEGVIKNRKTNKVLSKRINGGYNMCSVIDNDGKLHHLFVGRIIASTFLGKPPTSKHTADHIDQDSKNDILDNIRWLCKNGQRENQTRVNIYKSAFFIVKNNKEMTANDWEEYLRNEKDKLLHKTNKNMILKYAQNKQHGFSYKEYPDIQNEIWKHIKNSKNTRGGRWEISNMNRIKYITKYAENVYEGDRLRVNASGYPIIQMNGRNYLCHVLCFSTFFPSEYENMKNGDMILHKEDNKSDFRPHMLRVGSCSDNTTDAHNNGSFSSKKTERTSCASYINGIFEKLHNSQEDAIKYLISKGYTKASRTGIRRSLENSLEGKLTISYGRSWNKMRGDISLTEEEFNAVKKLCK
jgi:hypothetical protein